MDGAPKAILASPEFNIALFSFLMHFVWEFLQVPTYAGMAEMNHWDGIKLCLSATFGDVGFAVLAFVLVSLASRSRAWFLDPATWQYLLYLGIGISLTVAFEYYYTRISLRWSYSDLMPLVPPFGTGLSPLMQWLVIPALALWMTRTQVAGMQKRKRK